MESKSSASDKQAKTRSGSDEEKMMNLSSGYALSCEMLRIKVNA